MHGRSPAFWGARSPAPSKVYAYASVNIYGELNQRHGILWILLTVHRWIYCRAFSGFTCLFVLILFNMFTCV